MQNTRSLKDRGSSQMSALFTLSGSPGLGRPVPSPFKTKYPIRKKTQRLYFARTFDLESFFVRILSAHMFGEQFSKQTIFRKSIRIANPIFVQHRYVCVCDFHVNR